MQAEEEVRKKYEQPFSCREWQGSKLTFAKTQAIAASCVNAADYFANRARMLAKWQSSLSAIFENRACGQSPGPTAVWPGGRQI
jgi:hypothetical protein